MSRRLPIIHGITERAEGPSDRTVEVLDLEFSNGERRRFHRQKPHGHGAVVVVPMLDDDTVLLVREYAAGVHRYELGLVKGRIDAGETPAQAADRELKEEAGYGSRRIDVLRAMSLAPTYMSHQSWLVLARDLYPERLPGDEPEELEVVPWKLDALDQLMLRDDFSEGRSLAALFIAREWFGEVRMILATADLREAVIAIAREAAVAIMGVYENAFEVEQKSDSSPLTAADMAAHHIIVDGLERLTPEWPILSEESADIPWETRQHWTRYWLVDPLDGTREFVKRNGEFTVNIALIDGGVSVFGVVLAPVGGALWHGARGEEAYRRDGETDVLLRTRAPATGTLRVAASRSHRDARTEALLVRIGDTETIGLGSSLKFCRIAEGSLDVYPRFGPTSEWDTAAAQCVLEAAGGVVIAPDGRSFRYNQRPTLLNGDFLALGDPELPWKSWL